MLGHFVTTRTPASPPPKASSVSNSRKAYESSSWTHWGRESRCACLVNIARRIRRGLQDSGQTRFYRGVTCKGFGLEVDSQSVDDSIPGQYRHELLASIKREGLDVDRSTAKRQRLGPVGAPMQLRKTLSSYARRHMNSLQCKGDSPDFFIVFSQVGVTAFSMQSYS